MPASRPVLNIWVKLRSTADSGPWARRRDPRNRVRGDAATLWGRFCIDGRGGLAELVLMVHSVVQQAADEVTSRPPIQWLNYKNLRGVFTSSLLAMSNPILRPFDRWFRPVCGFVFWTSAVASEIFRPVNVCPENQIPPHVLNHCRRVCGCSRFVAVRQHQAAVFPTNSKQRCRAGFGAFRGCPRGGIGGTNHRWKLAAANAPATAWWVLVMHGNGGCALQRVYFARPIHDAISCDVFILEYPGYGMRDMREVLKAGWPRANLRTVAEGAADLPRERIVGTGGGASGEVASAGSRQWRCSCRMTACQHSRKARCLLLPYFFLVDQLSAAAVAGRIIAVQ